MTEKPSIAYQNGDWVNHDQVTIPLSDLGFRQGVTAVERLRTYGGLLFQGERHLQRWLQTCEHLYLADALDGWNILDLTSELLERNHAFVSQQSDVSVVWLLTPGGGSSGTPTCILHLQSLDADKAQRWVTQGQPLVVTEVQQPDPKVWPRHIKIRSRLHYYLADMQARQSHPEASGILLDGDGAVTETSLSNLAVLRDGQILSPKADRVLPGVTQWFVEQIASGMGLSWQYQALFPQDLHQVDGILLMGTDVGLWFANSLNGHPIPDGGEWRVKLRHAFDRAVQS